MKINVLFLLLLFFGLPCQLFGQGRFLVLGNSITRHAPQPSIGWFGDWGMAASVADSDYVHHLTRMTGGGIITTRGAARAGLQYGTFNLEQYSDLGARSFDWVILFIGDSVHADTLDAVLFRQVVLDLIDLVASGSSPEVLVVSRWWANSRVDGLLSELASQEGWRFASIAGLRTLPGRSAEGLFDNPQVAGHPGDLGMADIATRIYHVMTTNPDSASIQPMATKSDLLIWPNPTKGPINILNPILHSSGKLSVFNIQGRLIASVYTESAVSSIQVDLGSVSSGLYGILYESDTTIRNGRVVVIE